MPSFDPPSTTGRSPAGSPGPGVDPLARRLMSHYAPVPRGLWVLKIGGVYSTVDYPTVDQVNLATEVYPGGTTSVVSDAVAAALTAAGYAVDAFAPGDVEDSDPSSESYEWRDVELGTWAEFADAHAWAGQ